MKATLCLLSIAAVFFGHSNGQFSDQCMSRPMREVPITLQIKRASGLTICGDGNRRPSSSDFTSAAEREIRRNYQTTSDCNIVGLEQTSCESFGRRGRRVLIKYTANVTCSDGCFYLDRQSQRTDDVIQRYNRHLGNLLNATRTQSNARFDYNNREVEIFYFRGRKGDVFSACSGRPILDGVNKKIPACRCPSDCADPCTLPPVTGNCRGFFPRYYHNSTFGQCELFTYGGCGGNQNRFDTREDCEKACKVCPNGKEYQECGTACPITCQNKDDIPSPYTCTLQCVQGCFCPAGTVEFGDGCVVPEECPSTECPKGMVYEECGTACPTTCDNKDDLIICTLQCVSGCFCNGSTIILEEGGEKCVAPEECPVKETPECPEGMVYHECGTACPTTCDNKDDFNFCTFQCAEGCFCETGTILLEEEGEKCVAPEDCPVKEEEECPEGMVYKECGTACPTTCDNKDDLIICTLQCVAGCFCNGSTILLEEGGEKCVAREDCPVKETPECPEGMVYEECGTACPTTCDNKDDPLRICTLQCVQGCFCNGSTILLDEGGEKCVAPEDCPVKETPECPEGMVYEECGTACPTTCDNKDDPLRICTLQCVQGCFCNGSTILLEEGGEKCVAPEDCPVKETPECPEGKEYKECGTACPLTCRNRNKTMLCTDQCVAGCFCPDGYVEKGSSCVLPRECMDDRSDDLCSLPPLTGPCRGYFPKYFYNSSSQQCERFIYGGCRGNENNFNTTEECERRCKDDLCSLPPLTGPCEAYFPRYFYNSSSQQCERFIYGGCRGNTNNFNTVNECERKCKESVTECPEGMVYEECGTACPTTCDNKDDNIICTFQCVSGCFCNGSTILLEEEGEKCVAPEDCPVKEEEECPEGMVYKECGIACPTTCDNKDDDIICIKLCEAGCFCNGSTILLEEEGEKCVAPEDCPVEEEEECPEGMVYKECGTACPTTCDNKDEIVPCTTQCVQGCFCNGSTILLEEGGEECVAPEDCPVKKTRECPEGMVYEECGTACPTTCDNKDDVIICTKQCEPGCFCSEGTVLVEEEGEECVSLDECPAK